MSANQQPNHDPLEIAIQAFRGMTVPQRPPDAQVLAQFGAPQADSSQPACVPIPPQRRYLMHLVVSSTAAAALLLGGLALFLRNNSPPESDQVAATASSAKGRDVAAESARLSAGRVAGQNILKRSTSESLRLRPFGQDVADAQVIVVATALGSAPAPPHSPGDVPEVLIRFKVKRVLKGKLSDKIITTRTLTAAAEFIGKDWVILLSPEYMAGKWQYASHINVKLEPTVKAILPKSDRLERASVDSFEQRLAESQVIVVATALDSAPAPPEVPGDSPEVFLRFRVKRVLKGKLAKKEITIRTSVAPALLIGREWIVWLSHDYMAGKHQRAACSSSECEPTILSMMGIIREIKGITANASVVKGLKWEKPLVVRSEKDAAAHFSKAELAKLKKQVDFKHQFVLVLGWKGSPKDKVTYNLVGSSPELIAFYLTEGGIGAARPHVKIFVLRANVKWSIR
jgi:hypothetical protein